MSRISSKWRAGVLALAVAGAVAVPAAAFAQSGQATVTAATGAAAAAAGRAGGTLGVGLGGDGHRGPRVDPDALAGELGVTTEALTAALERVRESVGRAESGTDRDAHRAAVVAALAQALGIDAATLEAAVGEYGLPFGGHGLRDGGAKLETLATTLGIAADDLRAALADAKSSVARPADGGDLAAYRAALAGAVASTLGLEAAAVEAAFDDAGLPLGGRGIRSGAGLDALAETLGVTSDAIREAIAQAHSDLGRPSAETDRETYRAAFLSAVAGQLGIDPAALEAAIADGPFPFGGPGRRGGHHGPRFAPSTGDGGTGGAGVSSAGRLGGRATG